MTTSYPCECLGFVHDENFRLRCVDCGADFFDLDDDALLPAEEPVDDEDGDAFWKRRTAEIAAERNGRQSLRERIDEANQILAVAADSQPAAGSLAAMAVEMTRDRRDRDIRTFAAIETEALLVRVAATVDNRGGN